MAVLYTNPKGEGVTRHSYSSGSTWAKCKRLYFHEKISGWRRKDKSAAMNFGKAVEDAIQYYHVNGLKPDTAADEFRRIWILSKENAELVYTAKEKDWANLRDCGVQLLKLYEILLPTFPIKDPVWQASYAKEVFPGSSLAGLEAGGFVDLISRAPWVHAMLPKVDIPKDSPYRPVVVDIKTAGLELSISTAMLALDQQLQVYAWLSGIPDVAFLWLTKGIASAFSKGTEVTFLEPYGKWKAGDRAVILEHDSEAQTAIVGSEADTVTILAELSEIKGKGSTAAKDAVIQRHKDEGKLSEVSTEFLTKLKIQFLAVRISPEDIKEAGEVVGRQIAEIHQANETGFYPKSGGVRFPNNICVYCSHRGLCIKDERLVDELLVRISPTAKEEDWLDDIGGDEE